MVYLKPFSFITLLAAADWLKFEPEIINAQGDTKATLTIQDIKFTAKNIYGADGNLIKIGYTSGSAFQLNRQNNNEQFIVTIPSGSTAQQVVNFLTTNVWFNHLFTMTITGTASAIQVPASPVAMTGGIHATKYVAKTHRAIVDFINASCEKLESITRCPIITREFQEEHDGNSANAITPSQWPIRTIGEIRIDYNRQFSDATILPQVDYFLRGEADRKQVEGNVQLSIVGQDIVLRDDNEKFILGRVFSGSVLGSIRIKYTAGWGSTMDDLPSDIVVAGKQLMEFLYYQRENRDIAVQSKGVKGESYTRLRDGIPESIYEMVEQYIDVSLGTHSVPQRNYMRP